MRRFVRSVVASPFTQSDPPLLEIAFSHVNLNWQDYVEIDPQYFRPTEVDFLLGDPTKSQKTFGWKPTTSFKCLIEMMVESDTKLANREATLANPHAARSDSRNRTISFRLSPEEYDCFRDLCFSHGLRSLSELARVAELESRLQFLSQELKALRNGYRNHSDDTNTRSSQQQPHQY